MKILCKILIFFSLFISFAGAEVIKEISVKGNKRISPETIIVLGKINLNKAFNQEELNNIVKNLYQTNFFSDINIQSDNDILIINVVENPIIENIEITGINNKKLLSSIQESLNLKNRVSFSNYLLEEDINQIKNLTKALGYYFSSIKSSLILNELQNSVNLKINIDLGNRAKIKKINFIGDKKIKDKRLLEIIASEEHKFWKFISRNVYLNEELINLDKRLLEKFYKDLGYYKVQINDAFVELDNSGDFNLTYSIDAENRYYFGDLSLKLPDDYNNNDFIKIDEILEKLENEPYSLKKINLVLNEIERIASLKLYDFINADVQEELIEDNKIKFTFMILDTEKFFVERINILGNFNTLEEVIRNNLLVDEGDPLNEILFNKSINNIRSKGYFKNVNANFTEGSSAELKIIDIKVEEQPTGEISLGAGYGTSGTVIGGGIQEKNFLGKGINLNTNLEISEESIKGQFIYAKPNFLYSDNTLFTSLSSSSDDFLSTFGYKVKETGFSLGTKFEQYENFFFSPEIDLNFEDLETNSNASTALKKQQGQYQDFYFNYSLEYDLRDSSFRPTSGSRTSFYQQLPLVSENYELSNIFNTTIYKSLNESSDLIGKASFYFKNVNALSSDKDVRISKRAHIPYNKLRGFERGKIGPIDNSDYIGGNYATSVNLSTNLPQIISDFENIDLSYFIDFGSVWGVDYDASIINDDFKIRASTGIGIDLITPVGPLTFSFTQPILKESSDKEETFRFNLGTTF
jgi:outer membrane protein insertion porin family